MSSPQPIRPRSSTSPSLSSSPGKSESGDLMTELKIAMARRLEKEKTASIDHLFMEMEQCKNDTQLLSMIKVSGEVVGRERCVKLLLAHPRARELILILFEEALEKMKESHDIENAKASFLRTDCLLSTLLHAYLQPQLGDVLKMSTACTLATLASLGQDAKSEDERNRLVLKAVQESLQMTAIAISERMQEGAKLFIKEIYELAEKHFPNCQFGKTVVNGLFFLRFLSPYFVSAEVRTQYGHDTLELEGVAKDLSLVVARILQFSVNQIQLDNPKIASVAFAFTETLCTGRQEQMDAILALLMTTKENR